MKVLVACEESQRVCTAFREKGHEAYSCDIQECSGGHPEWHIRGDALEALKGGIILTDDWVMHDIGKWDMLIAHPPCTYLSNAGACRLFKKIDGVSWINADRFYKGLEAKEFFLKFLHADIPRIAVENPIPSKVFCLPQYTQIIQPYFFGDPYEKKTCLWLKGIPPLEETKRIPPPIPLDLCREFQSGRDKKRFCRGDTQTKAAEQNLSRRCKGNGRTVGLI